MSDPPDPPPGGAPAGRGRRGPLADRAGQIAEQLASATELGLVPDPDSVRAVGDDAVAAARTLLPDGACQPILDVATLGPARGWAVLRAPGGIPIGKAGLHGRPGGKPTGGSPARTALRRLLATVSRSAEHGPAATVTDARHPA
ncbi:hypothetical protein OG871_06665 [Kitasatospora sp. NBC_00374]|uniref:hypothetical protein n=1 Tax=Kitasatospora sp. NBC_00374 TaxID=2975964 RepID=UPI0030DF44BD